MSLSWNAIDGIMQREVGRGLANLFRTYSIIYQLVTNLWMGAIDYEPLVKPAGRFPSHELLREPARGVGVPMCQSLCSGPLRIPMSSDPVEVVVVSRGFRISLAPSLRKLLEPRLAVFLAPGTAWRRSAE
jgi:hypothetical protein